MTTDIWTEQLTRGASQLTSSAIRELLKVTEQPAIISFAGGLPAPECFPVEELAVATQRALAEYPAAALQYGPTEGYTPLRLLLTERMASLGVRVPMEQVLITSGSQQALDILGKLFLDRSALAAVEKPTYLGALQAWRPYGPRFAALPMDEEGLLIEEVARWLKSGVKPSFLYIVSSFQNPTGITLSPRRRQALLEIAASYRLPIIEDDPYGELYYSGTRPTLLAALDMELHGELRHVVYLGTFSKVLAPGLRVGWVATPAPLVTRIVQAKQGLDLHTGSLAQVTIYEACRDGRIDRRLPPIRALYHTRRDAMLSVLSEAMPPCVTWTHPAGGMFIWMNLPDQFNATDLLSAVGLLNSIF